MRGWFLWFAGMALMLGSHTVAGMFLALAAISN